MKAKFETDGTSKLASPFSIQFKADLSKLGKWLNTVSGFIVMSLIPSREPRILRLVDRNGNPYWYVYDPTTQQAIHFISEVEVRKWLEQRYYIA